MATKTDRIETRVSLDERHLIDRAAALEDRSVSSFVVAAALERANAVILAHDTTSAPASYFDRLLTALDAPDDAPTLRRAVRRSDRRPRIQS